MVDGAKAQSSTSSTSPERPESTMTAKKATIAGQSGEIQLVTFKLGTGEYGIDIMQVQEIIRLPEIVRVPKAPEFVEGVINLREQILPIIDLAKRFGAAAARGTAEASEASGPSSASSACGASGASEASGAGRRTDSSRIVVANIKGSPAVGLIVDAVCEVIRIPIDAVEPLPDIVAGVDSGFLRGIGRLNDRLIILVDLGKVLSADETAQLQSQLQGDFTAAMETPS